MNKREVFEEWAVENNYHVFMVDGIYHVESTRIAWEAWQASAKAERESCAKICDHYATAIDLRGNEYIRSGDCKQAAKVIRDRK